MSTNKYRQRDRGKKSRFRIPPADKTAFVLALFLIGGMWSSFGFAPFPAIEAHGKKALALLSDLARSRPALLQAHSYEGSEVVTHEPLVAKPGLTLVQGLLPGGAQIRMIDMEGAEIHRWNIDAFEIWSDSDMDHVVPAGNVPTSPYTYHTQGFWPLPDGSVIANVSGIGAVLLDKCSRTVWTVDRMTHHSVTPASGDKFWLAAHIPVHETPADLFQKGFGPEKVSEALVGTLKNFNNSVLLVDQAGQIEKEFSVLQAVHDAGLENALYASAQEIPADPTHLNDIEVVTPALADRVEDVATGDILVSLREMHMLAILDQNDGHMKWHQQGPWLRQHDPDIMDDGTIELFNNRARTLSPSVQNSQVLSFDPSSGETRVMHPASAEDTFYSPIMGTHQRLENNNLLISEALAGRVFEATPDGRVVWDYRRPYDDEVASLIEASMRVPEDYFEVESWNCEEK